MNRAAPGGKNTTMEVLKVKVVIVRWLKHNTRQHGTLLHITTMDMTNSAGDENAGNAVTHVSKQQQQQWKQKQIIF